MSKSATVTISYDINIRRTVKVEAENEEIDELLSIDGSSYLQLPKNLIEKFESIDSSYSKDLIQSFPKNIVVVADYDDPDDMIINKSSC